MPESSLLLFLLVAVGAAVVVAIVLLVVLLLRKPPRVDLAQEHARLENALREEQRAGRTEMLGQLHTLSASRRAL